MHRCSFAADIKKRVIRLASRSAQCNLIGGKTRCCFVPVHHVPERFDVVRATVLEFQVVSVFPHVQAHNREAGSAEIASPISGESWLAVETTASFVAFQHQPRPARAETGRSGFFKFRFEVVNGTEIALDSRFQVALQGGTGFQAFPEQAVVSVAARVVTQYGFLSAGS
jgi:hypothetical protein